MLFNGGVFKATELRRRVLDVLTDWAGQAGPRAANRPTSTWPWPGAPRTTAWCAAAKGVRIRGGAARSYYVGIETSVPAVPGVPPPIKALCVVPFGMEEGTEADVPGPEFGLVVGEPAEFRFLGSTTRRDDPVGTILDRWNPEEIQELAPLETALAAEEGARARPSPSGCTRTSTRSARSSSGARAPATTAAGSSSSTSANPPGLIGDVTADSPRGTGFQVLSLH